MNVSRTRSRPAVVCVLLGLGLSAPVARAQSPGGPLLPPLPVPPVAVPLPIATHFGDRTPPPDTHVEDSPSAAAARGAAPPETTWSANSPAELAAWQSSRIHEVWYGWQTLAFDAGAVASILVGAEFHPSRTPLAVAAVGVYAAGPFVIHLAHGSIGSGLGSLALRIGLPAVGYLAGECLQKANLGGVDSGAFGFVAGAVGAAAVDASVLGWDRWETRDGPGEVSVVALRAAY